MRGTVPISVSPDILSRANAGTSRTDPRLPVEAHAAPDFAFVADKVVVQLTLPSLCHPRPLLSHRSPRSFPPPPCTRLNYVRALRKPWSGDPSAPKISYNQYFCEKPGFAGLSIGSVLYGIRRLPHLHGRSSVLTPFVRLTLGISSNL